MDQSPRCDSNVDVAAGGHFSRLESSWGSTQLTVERPIPWTWMMEPVDDSSPYPGPDEMFGIVANVPALSGIGAEGWSRGQGAGRGAMRERPIVPKRRILPRVTSPVPTTLGCCWRIPSADIHAGLGRMRLPGRRTLGTRATPANSPAVTDARRDARDGPEVPLPGQRVRAATEVRSGPWWKSFAPRREGRRGVSRPGLSGCRPRWT
jgi:hypothetical protein